MINVEFILSYQTHKSVAESNRIKIWKADSISRFPYFKSNLISWRVGLRSKQSYCARRHLCLIYEQTISQSYKKYFEPFQEHCQPNLKNAILKSGHMNLAFITFFHQKIENNSSGSKLPRCKYKKFNLQRWYHSWLMSPVSLASHNGLHRFPST